WDSSSTFGGLWRTNAATGATTRVYAATSTLAEPAVLSDGAGGDNVYVAGQGANAGGLDRINYNGGVTTGPTVVVSVADLKAFMETASTPDIRSIASDADGNVYFEDNVVRNVIRLDSQGRLAKLVSKAERDSFYGVT